MFKKGDPLCNRSGRPAGKPNQTPAELQKFFLSFLQRNMKQLQTDFDAIQTPENRIDVILKLAKLILPKSFEIKDDRPVKQPIIIEVMDLEHGELLQKFFTHDEDGQLNEDHDVRLVHKPVSPEMIAHRKFLKSLEANEAKPEPAKSAESADLKPEPEPAEPEPATPATPATPPPPEPPKPTPPPVNYVQFGQQRMSRPRQNRI